MESRWYSLRANRPYQKAGMTVEVYYHQFYDWRDEIAKEGYQCSEESIIDDFIVRMSWDLLVRMYAYPSPPFSLSDAFRRAQFEESIMSLEELTRKIRADKVFKEMPHPITIDTAEAQGDEDVPDNNVQDVLGVPGFADDNFQLHLKSNELHLNILNPWSESEIKQAYLEGNLTDEAKKDEQSQSYKLVSREIIYPMNAQVIKPLITIDALTCIGAQNNRWSILMEEGLYSYKLCISRGKNLAESRGCKDGISLIDNDVMFLFDPGGCTLSKMKLESSNFYGDQGGLCLAFALAPNFIDALVNAISHKPWIREAYGYGDVVEYSGTKKEFVGKGSAQNALTPWSAIDRDCEGRKIHHVILRDVLDSFIEILPMNVCVCVVDWCVHMAYGLALQLMFDILLVFSHFQASVLSARYKLTSSTIDNTLGKLVLQGPGHCIFLEHVKCIHRALESDNVALVWRTLCSGSRVEEIRGLFGDSMIMDGNYDADQESQGSEYLIYKFSVTDNVCYLFDPGGGSFLMITWNLEIYPFLCGSDIATTIMFLLCIKKKNALPTQPTTMREACEVSFTVDAFDDMDKGIEWTEFKFFLTTGYYDIYVTTAGLHAPSYTEHLLYAWLGSNDFGYQNTVVQRVIKNIQCCDCFEPSQVFARRCYDIESLIVGLNKERLHYSALIFGTEMVRRSVTKQLHKLVNVKMVEEILKKFLVGSESVKDKKSRALFVNDIKQLAVAICAHGLKMARVKKTRENLFEGVVNAKLQNFVWDPGYRIMYFDILEDNDVLKGNGIGVRLALKQDGLNGAFAYYSVHLEFLACTVFDLDLLVLLIIWALFQLRELYDFFSLIRTLFDFICIRINSDHSTRSLPSCIGSRGPDFEEAIDFNYLINAPILGGDMNSNSVNYLQYNGYLQTTLCELGYIDVTIPHKEMLRTFSLLRFWKRHCGSRKVLVVSAGTNLENFVWNPGLHMFHISLFPILEDKDVLKGKDLSGSKDFEGISYFVLFIKLFSV